MSPFDLAALIYRADETHKTTLSNETRNRRRNELRVHRVRVSRRNRISADRQYRDDSEAIILNVCMYQKAISICEYESLLCIMKKTKY